MAKVYYISGTKRSRRIGAITWQSQPEYDPWGPGSGWGCEDWRQWHIALVQHFGRDAANQLFKAAWDAQGSFDSAYNWCKYNRPWIEYFMNNGLDLRSALSAIIVPVTYLPGDVVTDVADTASALSNLIKPVAFIALLAGGAYVYKNYLK